MSTVLHAFPDQAPEAARLAAALGAPLAFVDVHAFPDGELLPRVPDAASTTLVYRSLYQPNARILELLLSADAWRRNGARRLILVAPYLPYMRQDQIFRKGEPVSQSVLAGLLDKAFDHIMTVDPHLHRTPDLQSLFAHAGSTHLFGGDALVDRLRRRPVPEDTLVVGPDVESGPWVARIAQPLNLHHTTLQKHRFDDRHVELRAGPELNPAGRPVLLVDDICSTGGTLEQAVRLLKSRGADEITVFVTHALGGPGVRDRLLKAGAADMLSTDSCPDPSNSVHLADLLAGSLREMVGP